MKKRINRFIRFDFEKILTFGHFMDVPQRQIAYGYLSYIFVGVLLLSLPFATKSNVAFVDNLFSITSAVSTTGLCTVSVMDSYTTFGQFVLLIMIQLGGLGYMTLSSFFLYRMTHHFIKIKAGVLRTSFTMPEGVELKNIVQNIVVFTFLFEIIGAIALFICFSNAGVETPLWSAIFHSVSSFCTAGFSIYNDSLEQFRDNFAVNMTISVLAYAGAMGFIVMHDLWEKVKNFSYKITFTTKIIVVMTLIVTFVGSAQLMLFEPTLANYPLGERFMISFFQTMSAMTTVGFNTIPLSGIVPSSALVMIMVMYIGASPSGTGGGMKSTTVTAVFAFVVSKLGLERDVTLFGHRLPTFRVDSALTTFVFYTSILFFGFMALTVTEALPLEKLFFEAASALGTVGLSMGITSELSVAGKIVLILLMYIGRIGVLTFGSSMLIRLAKREKSVVSKDDDIAI